MRRRKARFFWSIAILILILAGAAATRFYRLGYPPKFYFDEVYHAFTAIAYSHNDPRGYEWWNASPQEGTAYEWLHPPISKLLMALSIAIFGERSFAWRLPSAVFGIGVIFLTYDLTLVLLSGQVATRKMARPTALLAAFLASLDGLLIVQSRIAMNDIFVTAFILMTLTFYWRWRQSKGQKKYLILSGVFSGLAVATKWSGLFVIGTMAVIEVTNWWMTKRGGWRRWLKFGGTYILMPVGIYLLSYSQFFLQGHTLAQFRELNNQIVRYEFGLKATHPYQSKAWQWPILSKSVWYHVEYGLGITKNLTSNIYALANPILAWGGLGAMVWLLYRVVVERGQRLEYGLVVLSYLAVWVPWLVSPRIMFFFHYTPAMPFLAIGVAIFLAQWWRKGEVAQGLVISFIGLTVAAFIFFLPLWIGLPVPHENLNQYFWVSGWR